MSANDLLQQSQFVAVLVAADEIRVTVVATGLGRLRRAPQLVSNTVARKTGTYDAPVDAVSGGQVESAGTQAYEAIRTPAVWRRESASETVRAMERNGTETYDIPAFLRRQAD